MEWFRWYHGTVNDPKFRLIAKRADVPIHIVIAVWAAALERASQNTPRGTIQGWDNEVEAIALEVDANAIERIRTQANGLLFDDEKVIGWDRRQPKREDGSAERAKAWRQSQKDDANANELNRTQTNTDRVDKIDKKERTPHPPKGELFDEFWNAYPHRGKLPDPKKPAREKFERKVKNGVNPQDIIAGAKRYADLVRSDAIEERLVCMAVTWLNQDRWDCQVVVKSPEDAAKAERIRADAEANRHRIAAAAERERLAREARYGGDNPQALTDIPAFLDRRMVGAQ